MYLQFVQCRLLCETGDPLSHLLFNLFINNLDKDITNEQCGIKVGTVEICINASK